MYKMVIERLNEGNISLAVSYFRYNVIEQKLDFGLLVWAASAELFKAIIAKGAANIIMVRTEESNDEMIKRTKPLIEAQRTKQASNFEGHDS
jgi:hypothetical protein